MVEWAKAEQAIKIHVITCFVTWEISALAVSKETMAIFQTTPLGSDD